MTAGRQRPIRGGALPALPAAGAWLADRSNGGRLHAGVDLWGPVGRTVAAPEAGEVEYTGDASTPSEARRYSHPAGWAGYGPRFVVLRGDSGVYHLLAHLGSVSVWAGQRVSVGWPVGTVGVLEHPHVHWETRARLQPPHGAAVVEVTGDPGAWLEGDWRPWSGECPRVPEDTSRTPAECRPTDPADAREPLEPSPSPESAEGSGPVAVPPVRRRFPRRTRRRGGVLVALGAAALTLLAVKA